MSIGPQVTRAQKTWMVFTAIGNIAQAYDFSNVLLEIQVLCLSPKCMISIFYSFQTICTLNINNCNTGHCWIPTIRGPDNEEGHSA